MSFTLFLQSTKGVQETANTNSVVTFDFDWNGTPYHEGEYEITFAFATRAAAVNPTVNDIVYLHMMLGSYPSTFMSNNNKQQGTLLGIAKPTYLSNPSGGYACNVMDNLPIRISRKPNVNSFKVMILDAAGNLFVNPSSTQYMFELYFKAIYFIPRALINKSKSFSLILNSRNGQLLGGGTQPNAVVGFNVNWNQFSEHRGKFEVTSSFSTQAMANNITVFSAYRVEVDCFNGILESYLPEGFGGSTKSAVISFGRATVLGLNGQYGYIERERPPVILNTLPNQNQFDVSFYTQAGAQLGNFTGHWILTLFFKAI